MPALLIIPDSDIGYLLIPNPQSDLVRGTQGDSEKDSMPRILDNPLLYNSDNIPELITSSDFQQFKQCGFNTCHTDTGILHFL